MKIIKILGQALLLLIIFFCFLIGCCCKSEELMWGSFAISIGFGMINILYCFSVWKDE